MRYIIFVIDEPGNLGNDSEMANIDQFNEQLQKEGNWITAAGICGADKSVIIDNRDGKEFVQAVVDKANLASRKVVKSQGFDPLYAVTSVGQGSKASQTQICYVFLNPKLKLRAAVYNKRPVDLIGHFSFLPELDHLIYDEKVNDLFKWKLPIYQEDDLHLFEKE